MRMNARSSFNASSADGLRNARQLHAARGRIAAAILLIPYAALSASNIAWHFCRRGKSLPSTYRLNLGDANRDDLSPYRTTMAKSRRSAAACHVSCTGRQAVLPDIAPSGGYRRSCFDVRRGNAAVLAGLARIVEPNERCARGPAGSYGKGIGDRQSVRLADGVPSYSRVARSMPSSGTYRARWQTSRVSCA